MAANASSTAYAPTSDFKESEDHDPLVGISLDESTELWLIQLPHQHFKVDDFAGKEVTLKLHRDGRLGTVENSSGESFDIVSSDCQDSNAMVMYPGPQSNIVGRISRRVSLVNYDAEISAPVKAASSKHTLLKNQNSDVSRLFSSSKSSAVSPSLLLSERSKERRSHGSTSKSKSIGLGPYSPAKSDLGSIPSSISRGSAGTFGSGRTNESNVTEVGETSHQKKQKLRHVTHSSQSGDLSLGTMPTESFGTPAVSGDSSRGKKKKKSKESSG